MKRSEKVGDFKGKQPPRTNDYGAKNVIDSMRVINIARKVETSDPPPTSRPLSRSKVA